MSELEGSCMGYPVAAALDGYLSLIYALLSAGGAPFVDVMLKYGIWEVLCTRLEQLPNSTDISIAGVMTLLTISTEVLKVLVKPPSNSSAKEATYSPLSESLMNGLMGLLAQSRLRALSDWPAVYGGGITAVGSLLKKVIAVLYVPFTQPIDGHVLARIQKMIYNQMTVRHLIVAMRMMKLEDIETPIGKHPRQRSFSADF